MTTQFEEIDLFLRESLRNKNADSHIDFLGKEIVQIRQLITQLHEENKKLKEKNVHLANLSYEYKNRIDKLQSELEACISENETLKEKLHYAGEVVRERDERIKHLKETSWREP